MEANSGNPRVSFGRGGKDRESRVDPRSAKVIKMEIPSDHRYFKFSKARSPGSLGEMPAIPLSPEVLYKEATHKTQFIEIGFQDPRCKCSTARKLSYM